VKALDQALAEWEKEVMPPAKPDTKKTPAPIRYKPN
jgi:hypothetical protein